MGNSKVKLPSEPADRDYEELIIQRWWRCNNPAGEAQQKSRTGCCFFRITELIIAIGLWKWSSYQAAKKWWRKCAREGVKEEGSGNCTWKACIYGYDAGLPYHKLGNDSIIKGLVTPSSKYGAVDKVEKTEASDLAFSCLSCMKGFGISSLLKKLRKISGKRTQGSESLPSVIRQNVSRRWPMKELPVSKTSSKASSELIASNGFLRSRGISEEGSLTAINFFIEDKAWQCTGFDLHSKTWRRLPTFSSLPTPDPTLFKEYFLCGSGALMCANVSKSPHKEVLVVFNLLTGETRHLPSLNYPRNPVLIYILVDSATNAYKVVAAGSSSSSGEKHLSRRVEVYDSQTLQWEVAKDIPGPEFGLNEHQAGVCVDGILYFVAFLEADGQKGVVAFDVVKGEWLENRNCIVPFSLHSNSLQLVESSGNIYLFSEQEHSGAVDHCIDELGFFGSNGEAGRAELKNVIRVKKSGGRGLLVYPEYICVPYGKGKLCVFNSIERDGVVYDIGSGMQCEELEPPPESQRGDNFFSLNPVSFTLQPNNVSKP